MKLPVLLLVGSLAVNAAFAGYYFLRLAPSDGKADPVEQAHAAELTVRRAEASAKTQAAREAASRAQLWAALNSDDLRTLVARLRAAGFPPSVIRAMIAERIQARFTARMNALVSTVEDTPFWKPAATNSFNNSKLNEERNQIYRERARLLREVLGDDFFAGTGGDPTVAQRRQFGDLPKSKIDLIQRINDDYSDMTSQARAAMQGITLPEDREKFALLEREKHADLAAILTPQELEDYEMRNSQTTSRLRSTMTYMDASDAEFRTIFRIQQQFADTFNVPGGAMSAEQSRQRREATTQMNEQIKAALGPDRGADYLRASNYEYQQLAQLAQRENLPLTAAAQAFDLRASTAEASVRIGDDKTMNYDQKLAALQTLAQTTRTQLAATLGPNAGAAYGKSADWLKAIEHGTAVTIMDNGMSFHQIERPRPPKPSGTAPGN